MIVLAVLHQITRQNFCPPFPPFIAIKRGEWEQAKKCGVRNISISCGAIKWDRWRGVNYGSEEWFPPKCSCGGTHSLGKF